MISVEEVPNMPHINEGNDVGEIIVDVIRKNNIKIIQNDVLCVASKVISIAENNIVNLNDIEPSPLAMSIHKDLQRKDPRVIQLIIDASGDPSGSRLDLDTNHISAWLPNGMRLTSAGIDKLNKDNVALIPKNADQSAHKIAKIVMNKLGVRIGVLITDSDGRVEKSASTQIAIGLHGVPALRISESTDSDGKVSRSEESYCDLLAASAALIMGQRGTNKPVVKISGLDYEYDTNSKIIDSLSRVPDNYIPMPHLDTES